jgi:VIT1/CCC1 family predicted Fe2+/Mn2+ transporter
MTPEEAQRAEITDYHIYLALAKHARGRNRDLLGHIAVDELKHYRFWMNTTQKECGPSRLHVWWYCLLATIFGLTFALKLRESREHAVQQRYKTMAGAALLIRDEARHERELIGMLEDERLAYAGSIVLGLNDGLVELTGVLAGLTLALNNTAVVAVAGLVTGLAAAMSMAASGYFSAKEEADRNPARSAVYTGITYLVVVILLVLPYFLLANIYAALCVTIATAVLLIAAYSFFIAVAKSQSFWRRFLEMAAVSLIVAAISFCAGYLLNRAFGI